eukprot:g5486.t1
MERSDQDVCGALVGVGALSADKPASRSNTNEDGESGRRLVSELCRALVAKAAADAERIALQRQNERLLQLLEQ